MEDQFEQVASAYFETDTFRGNCGHISDDEKTFDYRTF